MATVKGDVHDIGKNIVGVVLGCNNYQVIDLGVMVSCEKILQTARDNRGRDRPERADHPVTRRNGACGARDGARRVRDTPPYRGRHYQPVHTAVKISPGYNGPVVHVPDASRAVGVVGSLMSHELRGPFSEENRKAQEIAREEHKSRQPQRALLSLAEARARRPRMEWRAGDVAIPAFLGTRTLESLPLEQLIPLIDWSPFFHAWELRGRYPQLLDDPLSGARARELFQDARALLDRIVAEKLLTARGVYGFFPANAVGEDIEVYTDDGRTGLRTVFHTLRQQGEKSDGQPNFALADFLAPRATGVPDFLGCFAVTAGIGEHELRAQFEREHDDYSSILTKALADRLAEAFAEWLHRRARADWGYGAGEDLSADDLIHERYRGIRPAPGYPACPDHSEKRPLFDLIRAEDAAGIRLTENFAMMPASSICGFYFAHPQARYFAVGKIGRDQVLDYQRRKGVPLDAVERSLAVHLTYDPGPGATPAAMGI